MENLPGDSKGLGEAGDHEAVGIQVYMVISFLPQQLGSPKLSRADVQSWPFRVGLGKAGAQDG